MKPGNYTEMTAVCVHPSCRGRGYAQALLGAVAHQIVARGEIPFLHVVSNNKSAIALYRRQGMEIRRRLHVTVLQKGEASADDAKRSQLHLSSPLK
jgi:predicted GNAT family acetyltransferase